MIQRLLKRAPLKRCAILADSSETGIRRSYEPKPLRFPSRSDRRAKSLKTYPFASTWALVIAGYSSLKLVFPINAFSHRLRRCSHTKASTRQRLQYRRSRANHTASSDRNAFIDIDVLRYPYVVFDNNVLCRVNSFIGSDIINSVLIGCPESHRGQKTFLTDNDAGPRFSTMNSGFLAVEFGSCADRNTGSGLHDQAAINLAPGANFDNGIVAVEQYPDIYHVYAGTDDQGIVDAKKSHAGSLDYPRIVTPFNDVRRSSPANDKRLLLFFSGLHFFDERLVFDQLSPS